MLVVYLVFGGALALLAIDALREAWQARVVLRQALREPNLVRVCWVEPTHRYGDVRLYLQLRGDSPVLVAGPNSIDVVIGRLQAVGVSISDLRGAIRPRQVVPDCLHAKDTGEVSRPNAFSGLASVSVGE